MTTAQLRTRVLAVLLDEQKFTREQLKAFTDDAAILLPTESLEDWPERKLPTTKEKMQELVEKVRKFLGVTKQETKPAPDLKKAKREKLVKEELLSIDRLPPNSFECEQGVLGCILLSPHDCLAECQSNFKLVAEAFYDLRHQEIYKAIIEMVDRNESVDVVTLQQRLKDKGMLEAIGGLSYLMGLPDTVPSAANVSYYLEFVVEKFLLRQMITTCTNAVARLYQNNGNVVALLDEIEHDVLKVAELRSSNDTAIDTKQLVLKATQWIEDREKNKGKITGLRTGLIDLDYLTDGLCDGDMSVLTAFPSTGKTSLAMNIAEHVLLYEKKPVAVFTLEMSPEQLMRRLISSRAKVNLRDIGEHDYEKMGRAAAELRSAPLHVERASGMTIYQMRARARRLWQQYGVKLWVVDYLQLVSGIGGPRKVDSKAAELRDVSNGLKAMAMETGGHVLVLSQLNDDGKILESRQAGMDGDNVFRLRRPKGDQFTEDGKWEEQGTQEAEPIDLWIRKQRNGPAPRKVELTFLKCFTRFESAAKGTAE